MCVEKQHHYSLICGPFPKAMSIFHIKHTHVMARVVLDNEAYPASKCPKAVG